MKSVVSIRISGAINRLLLWKRIGRNRRASCLRSDWCKTNDAVCCSESIPIQLYPSDGIHLHKRTQQHGPQINRQWHSAENCMLPPHSTAPIINLWPRAWENCWKKMIARALRTDFWRVEFVVKSISGNFGENRTKSEIIIRNSYYESGRKSNSSISSSWKGSSRRFHCSNAVRVGGVCGGCAKHRWLKHFPADWGLLEERRVWGTLEELEFFDSSSTVCF